MIAHALRIPLSADDPSLLSHLLRLKDPYTGLPFSDDRLLPEIATFFFAGSDTTGHTGAWALVWLHSFENQCMSWAA